MGVQGFASVLGPRASVEVLGLRVCCYVVMTTIWNDDDNGDDDDDLTRSVAPFQYEVDMAALESAVRTSTASLGCSSREAVSVDRVDGLLVRELRRVATWTTKSTNRRHIRHLVSVLQVRLEQHHSSPSSRDRWLRFHLSSYPYCASTAGRFRTSEVLFSAFFLFPPSSCLFSDAGPSYHSDIFYVPFSF